MKQVIAFESIGHEALDSEKIEVLGQIEDVRKQ